MKYTLDPLPYDYSALEPFIDEQTMRIHHTKHHQTYIDKLNTALGDFPEVAAKPLHQLLGDLNQVPDGIRTAVRNHAGGHYNHTFFWATLKKEVAFKGAVADAIKSRFESFEGFKNAFSAAAVGLFGSGWSWLVLDGDRLEIVTTPNQDSPISAGQKCLLGLDVWEHAYYLKYQNRRPDYVEAFFNIINWEQVNQYFKAATS